MEKKSILANLKEKNHRIKHRLQMWLYATIRGLGEISSSQ